MDMAKAIDKTKEKLHNDVIIYVHKHPSGFTLVDLDRIGELKKIVDTRLDELKEKLQQ